MDQNHGLTPLVKCQFFDFFNFLFYSLARGFFVLEYLKRNFPGLYWLYKKRLKMANFGPTLWVNPFGKTSVSRLSDVFAFIGYKGVYQMQNIVEDIFLACIA